MRIWVLFFILLLSVQAEDTLLLNSQDDPKNHGS